MPALFLVVFVDLIGFGMVIPLLPLLGEAVGATPWDVGILMASFSAGQFVASPLWGSLSDRIGRKPIVLAGLAGSALCYFFMAKADGYGELLAARTLAGLMAGNISAAFAYAADITTPEKRAKGMGILGAAFGLGFIGGPALGGILAGSGHTVADFTAPAGVAAALSATAFALAFATLKEPVRQPAAPHQSPRAGLYDALTAPTLAAPLIAIFVSTFAFAGMESTFSMWSERALGWGPRENGFSFAFMGLVSALVQGGGTHRLVKKMGEWNTACLGAALLALGMAIAPFAESIAALAVPAAAMALGFGLVSPSLNSALSLVARSSGMGAAMGAGRSVSTAARALGPVAAGLLFGVAGRGSPFLVGATLLGGMSLVLAMRRYRE
jgi:MFS transporter, DHA1 family, tetracycline resistance protein